MTQRPGSPTDQVRVRCRDRVRLGTDVYLPGARTSRVPTVLVRTPYGRNAPDSLLPFIAERLTSAGYAVAVQDVRGRGGSGGVTVPFVHEVCDAADTLDLLVAQSFSDGQVACWGSSYYGFTAWAAAASGHPAVRALVTRYTSTRPAAFSHDGGVLRLGPMAEWLAATWSGSGDVTPALDWSTRPLGDLVHDPYLSTLQGVSADDPAGWGAVGRAVSAALGTVPTLHWTGLFDLFQRGQLSDWRASSPAPGQHLIASVSDHQDDVWTPDGISPDHLADAGAREAMLDRSVAPVIEFLDAYLRCGNDRRLPPVRWESTGYGSSTAWHDSPTWPPADAVRHTFQLSGAGTDGALTDPSASHSHRPVGWEHDPDDLVPMIGADWWRPLLRQGDASNWLGRSDICSFTTGAETTPTQLAGPVSLQLSVRSTAPTHHVVATLCDVAADGTSRVVLQAARRLPRSDQQVVIPLGDTAFHVPAGHRLRLHLASSCFPFYLPHSGSLADPLTTGILEGSRQELDLTHCALTITVLPHSADREVPS